jgi:hypothetical protein
MMHGRGKSDEAIVARQPANKKSARSQPHYALLGKGGSSEVGLVRHRNVGVFAGVPLDVFGAGLFLPFAGAPPVGYGRGPRHREDAVILHREASRPSIVDAVGGLGSGIGLPNPKPPLPPRSKLDRRADHYRVVGWRSSASAVCREAPGAHQRLEEGVQTIGGETRCIWTPGAARISRVIVKNARGHAFFEFGEPMLREPDRVWWSPLEHLTPTQREEFEHFEFGPAWPEVGSRMMTRMITGQDLDGSWVSAQAGIYRYAVGQAGTMLVRTVLREYLATEVFWGEPG